ncbi:MAG: hypothetical protein ACLPOO_19470 [Terriglobales bacterium]|jgi:hypothetical protein
MRTKMIIGILALSVLGVSGHGQTSSQDQGADLKPNQSVKLTFHGYVRDLACLMKFNEALKPSNDCALMCARAGSPLVIVTKEGVIYTPISDSIPDTSEREKLMPLVGSYVEVTGEMYQRSGIKAIVIRQIKKTDEAKS